MTTETLPGAPEMYRWDAENDCPAWLNHPELAQKIHDEVRRDFLFKSMTGYFDRRYSACKALKRIDPDCPRNDWRKVGCALKYEFGEEGYEIWYAWSVKAKEKFDGSKIRGEWEGIGEHPNPVKIGTILFMAGVTNA